MARTLHRNPGKGRRKTRESVSHPFCFLTPDDLHWFAEGTHRRLWEKMGAHPTTLDGVEGVHFAVWAPNAQRVSVVGDFNTWQPDTNALISVDDSGIWEGFVPGLSVGTIYKFDLVPREFDVHIEKSDPFAFACEIAPKTASVVWNLDATWTDDDWMASRADRISLSAPVSIYEVHLGSWRRHEDGTSLSYREIAPLLARHARDHGFTHVEIMPLTEHPYFASWGYQTTGYFAATSRYGTPQDLMAMIDHLHREGIGVILDWVPSHFPTDGHALSYFDGSHLYEHGDPRKGYHPDWESLIFDYSRPEVRSFLLSSAVFWLKIFHADGLRVDGVASMLYLDYSRNDGQWVANEYGGRENLDAIEFLRDLNDHVHEDVPDAVMIAEESTAWPLVSKPTHVGGLGFDYKWDMGWMHDTLEYFQMDPIFRKSHQGKLTFRPMYIWSEHFVLALSHDEVVHLKNSLAGKMPGDDWQKLANLRLLLAYQWAQPGKKLLFMGAELAQWTEWNHDASLPWGLLELPEHRSISLLVGDLNRLYREHRALHELDHDPAGFRWVDFADVLQSILSFLRLGKGTTPAVLAVFNFTPVPRYNYRIGVPYGGFWREILNTDAFEYGGTGEGNMGGVTATADLLHGLPNTVELTLPPLSAVFLIGDEPPANEAASDNPGNPGPKKRKTVVRKSAVTNKAAVKAKPGRSAAKPVAKKRTTTTRKKDPGAAGILPARPQIVMESEVVPAPDAEPESPEVPPHPTDGEPEPGLADPDE